MAQVVESLPSKHKIPSSNPSNTQKKGIHYKLLRYSCAAAEKELRYYSTFGVTCMYQMPTISRTLTEKGETRELL
jgi:hypothetical protein